MLFFAALEETQTRSANDKVWIDGWQMKPLIMENPR